MPTNNFIPSLIRLREAGPADVIGQLHAAFSAVTSMNADEVVSAYQTVTAMAEEMNATQEPMVQRLLRAFEVQMLTIVVSGFPSGRRGRAARFEAVLGRRFAQEIPER